MGRLLNYNYVQIWSILREYTINLTFMKCLTLLLTIVFLSIGWGNGYTQIQNPEIKSAELTNQDFWPQTLTGSHFNEFWNYTFLFDNGMKLYVTYSAANFGRLKSPVTGVRLSLIGLNGDEIYQLAREYPIEQLEIDTKEGIMNLNPRNNNAWIGSYLPESQRVYLNTSKDGVRYKVNLKIEDIIPGIKIGDGKYRVRNDEVGIVTHIPFGKVSGIVGINENHVEVTGSVYMDHTFQNQTTTQMMNSGYRFIHHENHNNWDVIYFMLPNNNRDKNTIGYRLQMIDGMLKTLTIDSINSISSNKVFGTDLAQILELKLSDKSTIRLSRQQDIEKFSVFDDLPWVARRAARTFLGGEVIDFRGEAILLETGNIPKQGFYNFFVVD